MFYFLLPILAAYFSALWKIQMLGPINFGYLFMLSRFVMAFFVAIYCTKVANEDFDKRTEELILEIL